MAEGAKKPDFKELTKRPAVYKLEPEFENILIWGNKGLGDEDENATSDSMVIVAAQCESVSGPELLQKADGVDDPDRTVADRETLEERKSVQSMTM